MGVFGVFVWVFGSFCVACAVDCVPETARCSKYWEKKLPHKNLMASEDELDNWCSKQTLFYRCLEDVFLEGKNGNLSYLPTNLLISKLFSEDLCSEGSKSRIQLLENAGCINQLDTDFCILPEYLEIVTPDDAIPSTRCSQAEKTFSCIAATMVLNCGFDAARVYRTMLKITRYSDEVCGIEQSEGIPPCEESRSKSTDRNEKLSEIYYGLFHRIGNILDEDASEMENISDVKDAAINIDDNITEAVQSMIENLDKNVVSEECAEQDCLNSQLDSHSACRENITEHRSYMKNPIITEVLREILFYNYSGIEFAVYWRQPEFNVADSYKCDNLAPSYRKVQVFRCRGDYRYKDPDCVSNATVHQKLTPEFIRNFDPEVPCDSVVEFGPRPDWMKELDQLYEDKKKRDQMQSTTQSTVTEAPEIVTTGPTLLHIASTAHSRELDEKWYEKLDLKAMNMNSIFPNDIHSEVVDLLMPDLKSYVPPPMNTIKMGNSVYFIMYNSDLGNKMENLTCSRLDECHPDGKGLWKCRVWPRKIETYDTIEKIPPADTDFGIQYARPSKESKPLYERMVITEPTTESEILESSTPFDESIVLVSNDNTEYEKVLVDNLENKAEPVSDMESSMNDESDFINNEDAELKEIDEMDFDLIPDSQNDGQVRFKILTGVSNVNGEPEVVYAIHDAEDGGSEVLLATEDGLVAGKILYIKDESDLGDKYVVVSTPAEE